MRKGQTVIVTEWEDGTHADIRIHQHNAFINLPLHEAQIAGVSLALSLGFDCMLLRNAHNGQNLEFLFSTNKLVRASINRH